jgi:hypothetical protein
VRLCETASVAAPLHKLAVSWLLWLQGLEEGHTRPCWPIQTPGVGAHRSARRDEGAEAAASKRWDLLGAQSQDPSHQLLAWWLLARQSAWVHGYPATPVNYWHQDLQASKPSVARRQRCDGAGGALARGAAGKPLPGWPAACLFLKALLELCLWFGTCIAQDAPPATDLFGLLGALAPGSTSTMASAALTGRWRACW